MLETKRLFLRQWELKDVDSLYEMAKDSDVGPNCGWLPHTTPTESQIILEDVLMNEETFAICLKETNEVIGNINIFKDSQYVQNEKQREIGFWLGKKYWGKGYMSEACNLIIKYGFEELKLEKIWIAHHVDNLRSKRVQEKCHFKYSHMNEYYSNALEKTINSVVNCMTIEEYRKIAVNQN